MDALFLGEDLSFRLLTETILLNPSLRNGVVMWAKMALCGADSIF